MMKAVFLFMMVMCFVGCTEDVNSISTVEKLSDAEKIQGLVNYSLINTDELDKLIDNGSDDEKTVLKMIIDYNSENDDTNFSNGIDGLKSNNNLKKRALILSNNF